MSDRQLVVDENVVAMLQNVLLGFGTEKDRIAQTEVSQPEILNETQVSLLYEGSSLARKVIDIPPNDATRDWLATKTESNEYNRAIRQWEKDWFIRKRLNWAAKLARMKGGGALIVVTDDARMGSEIPEGASIINLAFAHRYNLRPKEFDLQIKSKGFLRPLIYEWSPARNLGVGADTSSLNAIDVHRDRVVRFEGLEVAPERASQYHYWGVDALSSAWVAIRDYLVGMIGVATTVAEFHFTALGVSDLMALLESGAGADGKTGREIVQERIVAFNLARSILNTYMFDKDHETVERLGAPVRGLDSLVDRLMLRVSEATEMPVTKLWGQAPTGLSTDDESGMRNWHDRIRRDQTDFFQPAYERILDLAMADPEGPTGGVIVPYEIHWHPLTTLNEKEAAEAYATAIRADIDAIKAEILVPKESRESRYRAPGFGRDVVLDDAAFEEFRAEKEARRLEMQAQFAQGGDDEDEPVDDDAESSENQVDISEN